MVNDLRKLSIYDLCLVLLYVCGVIACKRISLLRPASVLPFIVLAQMALFVRFITHDLNLMFYAAGNVAVVCAALVPMTLRKPIKAHWVK